MKTIWNLLFILFISAAVPILMGAVLRFYWVMFTLGWGWM
jgi:hypothetical protein